MSDRRDYLGEYSKALFFACSQSHFILPPHVLYPIKHLVGANDTSPMFRNMGVYCLVAPHFVASLAVLKMYLEDQEEVVKPKISAESLKEIKHPNSNDKGKALEPVANGKSCKSSLLPLSANSNVASSAQLPSQPRPQPQPRPGADVSLGMNPDAPPRVRSKAERAAAVRAEYGDPEDVPNGEQPTPTPALRVRKARSTAFRG